MKSSAEVCINEDSTLLLTIDEIEYSFTETDYLMSDKGKVLLKHQAVLDLAKRADVTVEEPKLLSSHSPVVYVFSRRAVRKGRDAFTAIGECNNKTLFDDIMLQNPASTADNRAVEKAILSVLGLHGRVYGATEINFKDGQVAAVPRKKQKKQDAQKTEQQPSSLQKKEISEEDRPFWWDDIGKDKYSEKQLDPVTFPVTFGNSKDKNWSVKQLYDFDYECCRYYAERDKLENANEEYRKLVYSCRRAIQMYGMKD